MRNKLSWILIIPIAIFLIVVVFLWRGLQLNPHILPSTMLGKTTPAFTLPNLVDEQQHLDESVFQGQVSLLNVWATWCAYCEYQHQVLMHLAQELAVPIYGLNYKDDPQVARDYLQRLGNPYQLVMADTDGKVAIDWGVYGTPEMFLIDAQGVIQYRHVGPIDQNIWEKTIHPLLQTLQQQKNNS
jgi:cytochrome c biogenesis protein CcmG/thiol:disulfide interchange protein DsbE